MKQIQELLLESEQLRLETDDAGPQVRIKKYYVIKTNISLHNLSDLFVKIFCLTFTTVYDVAFQN
jgi:hypothetical protein